MAGSPSTPTTAPFHLLQAAFYAVKLEVQRRNAAVIS
jgi:hypothetical protein